MALTGVEWGSADRCSVLRCSKRFSRVVTCLSLVALIAFAVGPQIGKAQAPSIAFVQAMYKQGKPVCGICHERRKTPLGENFCTRPVISTT